MNDTFFLIPKAGVQVRDPLTAQPLPAEGADKPINSYWLRRLRDGDVAVSDVPVSSQDTGSTRATASAAPKNKPTKE